MRQASGRADVSGCTVHLLMRIYQLFYIIPPTIAHILKPQSYQAFSLPIPLLILQILSSLILTSSLGNYFMRSFIINLPMVKCE